MEQQTKTEVRMPCDAHAWLRAYAQENNRSMNGQIVALLREAMRQHPISRVRVMAGQEGR
jgi:hypothetical protein